MSPAVPQWWEKSFYEWHALALNAREALFSLDRFGRLKSEPTDTDAVASAKAQAREALEKLR